MVTLRIYFFAGFHLQREDQPLPAIPSVVGRSLFAYLITYRDQPHTRDLLAGLFWPDVPDANARRRLSQTLWQIRRALDAPPDQPYILSQADTLQLNVEAPYWLDVEEFQAACSEFPIEPSAGEPQIPSARIETLRDAVALYQGDFLAGYYDDWALTERERLREMYLTALNHLVRSYRAQGAFEEALSFARQIALQDPLREKAHREVMRLCHLLGRTNEALQQYEVCRTALAEELDTEPTPATTALYREIVASAEDITAPYLPAAVSPAPSPLLEGAGRVPLVGRERERAALVDCMEKALGGVGGLALLEGEPGVGKSRLLQEVARDAEWREVQVLWGRGRESGELPPYGVLRDALEAGLSPLRAGQLAQSVDGIWLREVSLVLPQIAEWLPDLPRRVSLEPAQQRERLLEALARTIIALGQIAPCLLILDDLQWADEASLEALLHLTPRLAESRVLVIGSYRGVEARERAEVWDALRTLDRTGGRERLLLAPLTAAVSGELVRQALGLERAAPLFERRLFRETEGNPLFVLEALRALHDEGLLYRDEEGDWSTPWDGATADYAELPLSPELHRLIAGRLARLEPAVRTTLNTAAVLGADFDLALLIRASAEEGATVLTAVDKLLRRGLFVEAETTYHFSHDKVRQVTYVEIPEAERRRLHREAGDALEALTPEQVEALAYHFDRGGAREKALTYTLQAGERAQDLYDNPAALVHYERALVLAGDDPAVRWDILTRQEQVLNVLGSREAQVSVLDEMDSLVQILGKPVYEARSLYRRGELEMLTGDPQHALILLREAAELADVADEHVLRGNCLIAAARAHWRMADLPRCQATTEEARALFGETGDWKGEERAINMLGNLHLGMTGDYSRALAYFEQNRRLTHERGDGYLEATAQVNIGITRLALGDYQRALEVLNRALPTVVRISDRLYEALIRLWHGGCYWGLGDLQPAENAVEEALAIIRQIGDPNFEIEALALLGLIATDRGLYTEARDHFAQALEVAETNKQHWDAVVQRSHLALALARSGEDEEAHRLATQIIDEVNQLGPDRTLIHVVYFEIHQVFAFTEGLAVARPYLKRAHQALIDAADRIRDPDLRRSFLENVPENRAIMTAHGLGRPPTPHRHLRIRLVRVDAPTGRPLRDDERVEVTWTVKSPNDEQVSGKVARRQHRLLRLLNEAAERSAAPTVADLADALGVSASTLKRDLAALREAGHQVRTRGSRNR